MFHRVSGTADDPDTRECRRLVGEWVLLRSRAALTERLMLQKLSTPSLPLPPPPGGLGVEDVAQGLNSLKCSLTAAASSTEIANNKRLCTCLLRNRTCRICHWKGIASMVHEVVSLQDPGSFDCEWSAHIFCTLHGDVPPCISVSTYMAAHPSSQLAGVKRVSDDCGGKVLRRMYAIEVTLKVLSRAFVRPAHPPSGACVLTATDALHDSTLKCAICGSIPRLLKWLHTVLLPSAGATTQSMREDPESGRDSSVICDILATREHGALLMTYLSRVTNHDWIPPGGLGHLLPDAELHKSLEFARELHARLGVIRSCPSSINTDGDGRAKRSNGGVGEGVYQNPRPSNPVNGTMDCTNVAATDDCLVTPVTDATHTSVGSDNITDVWNPKSKLKLKLGHRYGELQIQKPNFGGGPGGERLRITTLITGVTSTSTSTSF